MYVAGCLEVEVKSSEEAFQVFWRGELFSYECKEKIKYPAVMIVDVTDLELLPSGFGSGQ